MQENYNSINIVANNYSVRRVTFDGKPHLVAPVVILTEGVHNGSQGPIFYPSEELEKRPFLWNGVPVPIGHPEKEGVNISANSPDVLEEHSVGRLFNTHFDKTTKKLRSELWIDEQKTRRLSPETIAALEASLPLEVSTGIFTDDELVAGTYNGKQYTRIARNFKPDHLALLPGQKGACSYADGCGVRVNQEGKPHMKLFQPFKSFFSMLVGNEQSYEDIKRQIHEQLDEKDNIQFFHVVDAVFDNDFVYSIIPNDPNNGKRVTYRRGYTLDDNGNVVFSEDQIEVKEEKNFIPLANGERPNGDGNNIETTDPPNCCGAPHHGDLSTNNMEGATDMKEQRQALLAALKANKRIDVTQETEDKLIALESCEKFGNELSQLLGNSEPEPRTFDTVQDFIATAPEAFRSELEAGLHANAERKQKVIAKIMAVKTNKYFKEELEAMPIANLEKIDAILPDPSGDTHASNFSGRAHGLNNNAAPEGGHKVEPLDLPAAS